MTTMIVTVKGGLRYASRHMVVGELFEASTRDALVLAAIGKAKPAPAPVRRAPDPKRAVADLEPESAPAAPASVASPSPPVDLPPAVDGMMPRNRYNRRDQRVGD